MLDPNPHRQATRALTFLAFAVVSASACATEVAETDPEVVCDDLELVFEACGFGASRDACLANIDQAEELVDLSCAELEDLSTTADNEVFFTPVALDDRMCSGFNSQLRVAITGSVTLGPAEGSVTAYVEGWGSNWTAGVDSQLNLWGEPGFEASVTGSVSFGVVPTGETVSVRLGQLPIYPGVEVQGALLFDTGSQTLVGAELSVEWAVGGTLFDLASNYLSLELEDWQKSALQAFFENIKNGLNRLMAERAAQSSYRERVRWPFPSVSETVSQLRARIEWIAQGGGRRCSGW